MRLPSRTADALERIALCLESICAASDIPLLPNLLDRPKPRRTGLEGLANLDEDELSELNKELEQEGFDDLDDAEAEEGVLIRDANQATVGKDGEGSPEAARGEAQVRAADKLFSRKSRL